MTITCTVLDGYVLLSRCRFSIASRPLLRSCLKAASFLLAPGRCFFFMDAFSCREFFILGWE